MHSHPVLLSYLSLILAAPTTAATALRRPVPLSPDAPPAATTTTTTIHARRETAATSSDADGPPPSPCLLVDFPATPTDPPACWAWFASTSAPSNYCSPSTFSSSSSSSSSAAASGSVSWLSSCELLLAGDGSNSSKDFFLAAYSPDRFNTLLMVPGEEGKDDDAAAAGCALQVRPARPPSDEQVYVGGADVADILGSAIGMARAAGGGGVEGSMSCGGDAVRWRMVPTSDAGVS